MAAATAGTGEMPAAPPVRVTLDEVVSDDYLARARQRGDLLADTTIHQIAAAAGGTDRVKSLLAGLSTAPDVGDWAASQEDAVRPLLAHYLEMSGRLPLWKDERLVRKAERFFQEHGFVTFVLLGASCLPELYTCGNGGTQVLDVTHSLVDGAARRIHQTAHIITDVMTPGGLKDGASPGVRSLQKVRLMHAAVRYLALDRPDPASQQPVNNDLANAPQCYHQLAWDRTWGTPIGQEYMAGTLQTFSYVILRGMRDLHIISRGVAEDPRKGSESAAYIHIWNVAGYILGIEEEFLRTVDTYADSERLFLRVMERNQSRDDAETRPGQELTDALLEYMQTLLDRETFDSLRLLARLNVAHRIPKYMIRKMIGSKRAALLTQFDPLDNVIYGTWNSLVTVTVRWLTRTRIKSVLRALLALDTYHSICALDPGGCPRPFPPPEELIGLWDKHPHSDPNADTDSRSRKTLFGLLVGGSLLAACLIGARLAAKRRPEADTD